MVNKVGILFSYLLISSLLVFVFSSWMHTPKLIAKVDNAILQTFEIDNFQKEIIILDNTSYPEGMVDLSEDRLFKIKQNNVVLGYGYLGETASMKRMFDYLILFNADLSIKKAKVLIYREEHGRQIGSQRWLKQFIGLTIKDSPIYEENIDAISGATISANSMTLAVGKVLLSIKNLKEDNLLK
ncbi:FMN-binding protein [uncultured Maribacter sp.]|uniref:FMN-binding protein n=1 Tax=uncultured Maribacter sp. TaxID=431308 RepID=UPI00263205F7|nr:FMN-binding protein [uncultured Maribacter sp.]